MKLARALALGAPVVADESSAASIAAPADALRSAASDGGFADCLVELLRDSDEAYATARRGWSFAAEELSWDKVTTSFTEAYDRAVEVAHERR